MAGIDRDTQEMFGKEGAGPVTCLGRMFASEDERRAFYTERLRAKLQDPAFRSQPGFPKGSDEDILRMSDPPWYTACPNPFLEDFVAAYGRPYDPAEPYHREPFAVDVSVGKTDPLYQAHAYHTKVPHLAIVPSILHYTKPGDLVLDGFCGSGMTGVAAQWCGAAPQSYRDELTEQWRKEGRPAPEWGARRAILSDLSPAATFIAAGYNLPFDVDAFRVEAEKLLREVEAELGWMYETRHTDGRMGRIDYTVWSEVFTCPECAGETDYYQEFCANDSKEVLRSFKCRKCGTELTKASLDRRLDAVLDPVSGEVLQQITLRPVLVRYTIGNRHYEKTPDSDDEELLARIAALPFPPEVPSDPFPIEEMYHGSRLAPKGYTHVHHMFRVRAAHALASMWRRAGATRDRGLRNPLRFFVEQAIWGMSALERYVPTHFSQVNQYLNGVYYIASKQAEVSPWYILEGKLSRLVKSFYSFRRGFGSGVFATLDCASIPLRSSSIDYVFSDPPFGENIFYADLNFLVESWHRVWTDATPEAIVDKFKSKAIHDYQELMHRCFAEYFRVLKPGRWMTVVFSNSSNAIWRAIQEAIGQAGFVVADVRTLDKQQGSYRQVTSTAVKQDLIISAYKPAEGLAATFQLKAGTVEGAWAFVSEHLRHVPVFVGRSGGWEVVLERTPQMLLDRMTAYHVQKGLIVPLDAPAFLLGLGQRYAERDGMVFLTDQVAEYDKKRAVSPQAQQLSILVHDEKSAIEWVRYQLQQKPRSFQDLQPEFMKEQQGWSKHEKTLELKTMLDQNFLSYDGQGPVPPQIHRYLSSNFHDLRNLDKEDPALRSKAKDRWYVPDPGKQADLEKLRHRALMREFQEYRDSKLRRLKVFRIEAIRAGFKDAYDRKDPQVILDVAAKLSDDLVRGDETLLMYYSIAVMRGGEGA